MIVYIDTSAGLKLLVEEAESAVLAEHLKAAAQNGDVLVTSMLFYTELHCAARIRTTAPGTESINRTLKAFNLVDLERNDFVYAAALPGRLRSADALHLAVALRVGADQLLAYDAELLEAADEAGLSTLSPR